MFENHTFTPPPGYIYQQGLFEDVQESWADIPAWGLLLRANFLALTPLSVGVIVLWIPYQFYLFLGTPLALLPDPDWPPFITIFMGLLMIIGSMILHELLHGLALRVTGYRPRFGFQGGMLLAGIRAGDYLTRNHYLIMSVTPLILMTLFGSISLIFLPRLPGQIMLVALLLNFAASIGDLLVANRVRRWPASSLFASNGDIHVFTPG
jgi:hypothetical protein